MTEQEQKASGAGQPAEPAPAAPKTETEHDEQSPAVQDADKPKNAKDALLAAERELVDLVMSDPDTQRYIEAANKLKEIAIRLTRPQDWVAFGETMHLQDQRLAELTTYLQSLYGLNVTILEPTPSKDEYRKMIEEPVIDPKTGKQSKDAEGKWVTQEVEVDVIEYSYTGGLLVEEVKEIPGRVRRKRVIQPVMGSATTADELWSKRHGKFIDPHHIQPSLVKKKAMANYRGNCLRYLWGLKGLTKTELEKYFPNGVNFSDSTIKSARQQADQADLPALDALWKRILVVFDNRPKESREFLMKITAYKDFKGHTDINRLKPGSYPHKLVVEALEKLEKEKGIGPEHQPAGQDAGTAGNAAAPAASKSTAPAGFLRYKETIMNAKSVDIIIATEKQAAMDKTLTQEQAAEIQALASRRADKLGN